ncbi:MULTISPECIES: helix-turn-helix domain-containing protein [Bacillus]|uniref:helix-turn-helix domain-containing protein n=2 Tax=Bacillus TaxID=1386 RepID=UPI00064C9740|nr:hypothetical protein ABW03_19495 [Bacillus altitudinis]RFB45592.1 XRE family transcriptional regulator [Bacillus sp. HMG]CVM28645.1 Predicted transcriptional regulator [Streptococcus pneumoniae]MBS4748151.1 helix-turn-helix domain-containing protein [Bacillus altitudinis]MBU8970289.1 helix-turn-helix transcriptional regulator [Bacillus altitudinis]
MDSTMIYFKLDNLLKQIGCSRNNFANTSGIRPNTINDMCNNKTKRIEIETLIAILKTLNDISDIPIVIEDLMEYREL